MKISVSLASQASKPSRWRPAGKEHDNSVLLSSVLRGFPPVCVSSRQATATDLEGEKKPHPSHLTHQISGQISAFPLTLAKEN